MHRTCVVLLVMAAHGVVALATMAGESVVLFNGRDFDGWVMTDGSPVNDGWEVVDGAIHLKPQQRRAGSIRTEKVFGSFELEFEWRVAKGGNSGVKYLAREADSPLGRHFFGCEYQLLDDLGHKNGRTPLTASGAIYGLYPPEPARKHLQPLGDFNRAKIVVDDQRIEHWLNGEKIVEATIGSDDWETRLRQTKFADVAGFAQKPGVILLQEHLSEAWFRNLRLTPLPKVAVTPPGRGTDAPPKADSGVAGSFAATSADGFDDFVAKIHAESLALREKLLRDTIAKDTAWPEGTWGDNLWCLAALSLNEKVEEANARLLATAQRYIATKPASIGRTSPEDPGDAPWTFFSVTDYVRTLWLFHADSPHVPGRLKAETEAAMKEALWMWVREESRLDDIGPKDHFRLLGTENHDLNRRPAYYLVLALLQGDPAYCDRRLADGATVTQQAKAYTSFFREWPRSRARTGIWVEVGANGYQKYSWPALFNLHELSPDPVIRHRFGLLLDLALIEEEQISVRGRRGGGRSRAYAGPGDFEGSKGVLYATSGRRAGSSHSRVIETSRYQAPPEAVFLRHKAFPTNSSFIIRNRVLGELALPGADGQPQVLAADSALVNYAYRTPHFLLGSTLQNPGLTMADPASGGPILKYSGISRQNRWAGVLFDNPASGEVACVGTVVRKGGGGRPQHPFWSVQHENTLVIERIPRHGRSTLGSYSTDAVGIGFHGKSLDKTECDGWIFAGDGKAFVGVRFLDGPYQWDEAKEIATPAGPGADSGSPRILLCAGDVASHGSRERFQAAVMANPLVVTPDAVDWQCGPGTPLTVTRYDPKSPDRFSLPRVGGVPIDVRPAATFESPFLNGAFGSDMITVTVGPAQRVLDFSEEGPAP